MYAEQGVYDKEHTVQLCHIVFVVRFLVSCIESCVRTAQTEAEKIQIRYHRKNYGVNAVFALSEPFYHYRRVDKRNNRTKYQRQI